MAEAEKLSRTAYMWTELVGFGYKEKENRSTRAYVWYMHSNSLSVFASAYTQRSSKLSFFFR